MYMPLKAQVLIEHVLQKMNDKFALFILIFPFHKCMKEFYTQEESHDYAHPLIQWW